MSAPQLFDRPLARLRRARARALGPATFLLDWVADDFADRLSLILRRFEAAADLATPTDALRRAVLARGAIDRLQGCNDSGDAECLPLDGETLPFAPASLDLIVSALALHEVNDLPGVMIQARRALKPDGLFMAAIPGGETLVELRQAFAQAESETTGGLSPRVFPFVDVRDAGALLQRAGLALPVIDSDRLTVRYPDVFALFADLRRMGATNTLIERRRVPLRRDTLRRLAEIYTERFADPDGRLRATFEIIWLAGWAPHESQQKPLAPGSAKMRLADALRPAETAPDDKEGA